MEDANEREETSAELTDELPDETPRRSSDGGSEGSSEGIAEETEYLPYTPGHRLPDEVEEVLEETMPPSRSASDAEAVTDSGGGAPDNTDNPGDDGGSTSEESSDELEEIRSIFLGQAASGQLDLAQVAASMEDRLESARREIVGEVAAGERRIRDEIKGAMAELLSEVEDRVLRRASPEESTKSIDEVLNLVSLTHGSLRADLDKHHHDTKHAMDDLVSLVRELACTLASLIGGDDEEAPGREETVVMETIPRRATGPDVDAPLLKELPEDRGAAPDDAGSGAKGEKRAAGEEAPKPGEKPRSSEAAKLFF